MGAVLFLPGQQSHFMKGAFLSTSASRIATPFFGKIKRGLHKGFYLSEALQSLLSLFIGHQRTRHIYKYIYFPTYVNKKMRIAKKYFSFPGVDRKKEDLRRVRIAKKNHSSLLNGLPTFTLLLG
jgi:hypothetical protein